MPGTPLTETKSRAEFLKHYRKSGNVHHACEEANAALAVREGDKGYIWRRTVLWWREQDEAFDDHCREAEQDAADVLEREAIRRAKEGWEEPVFNRDGDHVANIRKYDSTMLIFLLKGFKPEKFGDRSRVELTGAHGGPLQIGSARDALAERLAMLVERRVARGALPAETVPGEVVDVPVSDSTGEDT